MLRHAGTLMGSEVDGIVHRSTNRFKFGLSNPTIIVNRIFIRLRNHCWERWNLILKIADPFQTARRAAGIKHKKGNPEGGDGI